jgi:hypothetical protein
MKNKFKYGILSLAIFPTLFQIISPFGTMVLAQLNIETIQSEELVRTEIVGPRNVEFAFQDIEDSVVPRLHVVVPQSLVFVDQAITVLSKGMDGMNEAELEAFRYFFDPGNTGDIDDEFVRAVLQNYRKIRAQFEEGLVVELEPESEHCRGKRLHFTYYQNVHTCPYYAVETDVRRMARDFLHELVHIALLVEDRAYYHPDSADFAGLTPRGPMITELPVIGHLVGEITLGDTLNNPDSYAWFADALVNQ